MYARNPTAPKGQKQRQQKRSKVDHAALRQEYDLPPSANFAQIVSAAASANPPAKRRRKAHQPKSPPKKEVKRRNTILQKEVRQKSCENENLRAQKERLMKEVRELNVQLRKEKRASRKLIQDAQNNSEGQLKEARKEITNLSARVDELLKEAADQRDQTSVAMKEAVQEERHYSQRSTNRQKEQHLKLLQKIEIRHQQELQKQEKAFQKVRRKLQKGLDRVNKVAKEERDKWDNKLEKEKVKAANERIRFRDKIAEQLKKRKRIVNSHVINHVDYARQKEEETEVLLGQLDDMHRSLRQAKEESRSQSKSLEVLKHRAAKRLEDRRAVQREMHELKDKLAHLCEVRAKEQEILASYEADKAEGGFEELELELEFGKGRGGGRYPLWVAQACIELLLSGTPPSAVPTNIAIMYETLYQKEAKMIPSKQFVRQMRACIEVMGETITALLLSNASAEQWKQIFFDTTSRRQIPFQTVIIGLMNNGKIDPIVLSSHIFMADESSETTVDSIFDKVSESCLVPGTWY